MSQRIPDNLKVKSSEPKADDPRRFEWTFKAPVADLFNNQGKKLGYFPNENNFYNVR